MIKTTQRNLSTEVTSHEYFLGVAAVGEIFTFSPPTHATKAGVTLSPTSLAIISVLPSFQEENEYKYKRFVGQLKK